MSLQIRKLTGPDELHQEHITTLGSQVTSVASIADENAAGVFTCFFSRNVRATDYPVPTTVGEIPAINITISVYDNNGTFINRMTLAATQANIRTDRNLGHTSQK